MIADEKKGEKISLYLSPTSLNTFMQSPLLFYLTYIAKAPDDTWVPVCYGLSGNIVHDCLERYANKEFDRDGSYLFFLSQWIEKNLNFHRGVKDEILSKGEYLLALIKGLDIVDSYDNHLCEEKITMPFVENDFIKIGLKGFVDLQVTPKGEDNLVVIDYKTSNSIDNGKDFERQALFYNFLIYKKRGILPTKTIFHYLKLGATKDYSFSHDDINAFEEELKAVADKIIEYGTDISKYPAGDINDLFNTKRQACLNEIARRKSSENLNSFLEVKRL